MRCALTSLSSCTSVFIRRLGLFTLAAGLCAGVLLAAQDRPSVVNIAPAPAEQSKPAQTQSPTAPATKEKPAVPEPSKPGDISKEAVVMEQLITHIREETDGTGTRQTTGRVHVLADAGVKDMAVLQFTYTASNQQVDIGYVRVIKPDGAVVITPAYNVQDLPADVTRTAPMYSDIHQKHVAVKGLGVGDTLEYQITLTTLKPEVPGQFWFEYSFEKNLIILDEQVDLDLPADKTVTVASAEAQPNITTAAGRKLYHWSSNNLARPDPDAPPKSVKHQKPSIQVTTFSSWEQVGAWYQSLQLESLAVTPAIQAKANALTKGLTSDEDKMRAIFDDVALHIHYVGLEFGIGRYQPHPADDVLSNEYGDCKDKHTLLATELKAVGIDAWPVLISAGRELDPDTPSPAQFNHVITLVPLGGKLLWMDSTEEVAPVGVLMTTLRDKQALAIPGAKAAYLERTPIDLPFAQSASFHAEGKLSDQGEFTGHIAQSYHGDAELFMRVILRTVPQSQWKEFMQRLSNGTGFAGEVSNPQVSEIEQTSQPLHFSFDYKREKFGEWDNHRISPPMPPVGWELGPGVKEIKPADDPELGSPGEMVYSSSVQLPKGWSAFPPKQVDLNEDWAEYHSKYSVTLGTFTAERRVVVKKNKVPLDQWDKYLAFRRTVYADEIRMTPIFNGDMPAGVRGGFNEFMSEPNSKLAEILEPLGSAGVILATENTASSADLSKALDLSRKAVDAIEAKTLTLPLEDGQSLYWTEVLSAAWGMLGRAALDCKDLATAEDYLRAAWRLSEDRMAGYQLGRLLAAKGDKEAAAHIWELALITNGGESLGGRLYNDSDVRDQIDEAYKKLTGKPQSASALNNGQYNGSLRAELDRQTDFRGWVHSSKLSGQGLFILANEPDKPAKAHLLSGDSVMEKMIGTLDTQKLAVVFPKGSKARMLREIRLICTPYAGCDAYIFLPRSAQVSAQGAINPKVPTVIRLMPKQE